MATDLTVVERIQLRMGDLSPSHQRLAEFILRNLDECAFMTASELARRVDISQATVVRFASELELPGYPEFQGALQVLLRQKLTSLERFRQTVHESPEAPHLFYRVLQQDLRNLEMLYTHTNLAAFDSVVEVIAGARRVFVVASRAVGGLALAFGSFLGWVRPGVYPIVFTSAGVLDELADVGPGDLVIGISFPRYARRTLEAITLAREQGAATVAITDNPASPLGQAAGHVLTAPNDAISFVGSFVAPTTVLQALVVAVALQDKERAQANLEHLERIWNRSNIYLADSPQKPDQFPDG